MSDNNLFSLLQKHKAIHGLTQVVETVKGYREKKDGTDQAITVEIHDSKESSNRYTCVVTSKEGKVATGNPASTIQEAIAFVHWENLDK